MASTQIAVGLVEPIALFRDALAGFIESQPGLRVEFAVAADSEVAAIAPSGLDVLLVGASLVRTTFSPRDFVEAWQTLLPESRVVLMTDCCSRQAITAFLRNGLRGYLIRANLTMLDLIEAIYAVHDGSIKLCHETRQILFNPSPVQIHMTGKELEVIRALPRLRHLKRTVLARELQISPANLNNYISEIAQKLEVYGVDGIIERSYELGLLGAIEQSARIFYTPAAVRFVDDDQQGESEVGQEQERA